MINKCNLLCLLCLQTKVFVITEAFFCIVDFVIDVIKKSLRIKFFVTFPAFIFR